jgi:hypothetical protein
MKVKCRIFNILQQRLVIVHKQSGTGTASYHATTHLHRSQLKFVMSSLLRLFEYQDKQQMWHLSKNLLGSLKTTITTSLPLPFRS